MKFYSQVIKKHSKTFYFSSLLFPKEIREKIFLLYAYVRIIDDLVDETNEKNKVKFKKYKNLTLNLIKGKKKKYAPKIIKDFVKMAKKYDFDKEVIDYLKTQEVEVTKKRYKNKEEFLKFCYGVAGTIGVMIAKIINLPKKTFKDAVKLGVSLQIINNVRDIFEDYQRFKIYLPEDLLKKYKISHNNFIKKTNRKRLYKAVYDLIGKAKKLKEEAKSSFKFFKKRELLAIKTAVDIYFKIAEKIEKNPEFIFNKKILKPSLIEIVLLIIKNYFNIFIRIAD